MRKISAVVESIAELKQCNQASGAEHVEIIVSFYPADVETANMSGESEYYSERGYDKSVKIGQKVYKEVTHELSLPRRSHLCDHYINTAYLHLR